MTGRDIPSIKLKKVLEPAAQADNTIVGFLVLAAVFLLILWGLPALYEFVRSFK